LAFRVHRNLLTYTLLSSPCFVFTLHASNLRLHSAPGMCGWTRSVGEHRFVEERWRDICINARDQVVVHGAIIYECHRRNGRQSTILLRARAVFMWIGCFQTCLSL